MRLNLRPAAKLWPLAEVVKSICSYISCAEAAATQVPTCGFNLAWPLNQPIPCVQRLQLGGGRPCILPRVVFAGVRRHLATLTVCCGPARHLNLARCDVQMARRHRESSLAAYVLWVISLPGPRALRDSGSEMTRSEWSTSPL